MEFSFTDLFDLFIILTSVLFSVFLLTAKTENYICNLLLAVYLLTNSVDLSAHFVSLYIFPIFPGIGMFISSTIYFIIPTFFLYVLSVIYFDFKLKWMHLLHAVPFVLVLIVFMPNFYLVSMEEKINFLTNDAVKSSFEIRFTYIFLHLQIIAYLIAIIVSILKYKKLLLENYSNASTFNYKWLMQFTLLIVLSTVFGGIKNVFLFLDFEKGHDIAMIFILILTFFFICWIVLRALQSPELFRGIDSKTQLVRDLVSQKNNSKKDQIKEENIRRIKKHMTDEEPHLEPSLTLFDLATQLGMPTKELSVLINHDIGSHFFDFVNEYRIEKAKEILRNTDQKKFTISEILYEVGFNSKSSFNTAFKKHTRFTPSQYRKNPIL